MSRQPQAFSVVNNGHTIQANASPGGVATSAGRKYELQQFHFHSPSEQRRRIRSDSKVSGRQQAVALRGHDRKSQADERRGDREPNAQPVAARPSATRRRRRSSWRRWFRGRNLTLGAFANPDRMIGTVRRGRSGFSNGVNLVHHSFIFAGEEFGIKVGLGDEAVDGSLEIDNASKDTVLRF